MASPTLAQVQTQFSAAINIYEKRRLNFGVTTTINYISEEDVLVQALLTDFAPEITSNIAGGRANLDAFLRSARGTFAPFWRMMGKVIAAPETDDLSIISRTYQYFIDNSKSVKSRAFSFGTPTAGGGNVGTGVINRLNKDEQNYDIENQWADAKSMKCVQDLNSGSLGGVEKFEIRGGTASKDSLLIAGSGLVGELTGITGLDSQNLLDNPSFSQFSGTVDVATAGFTSWTVDTASAFTATSASTYRPFPGETTSYAAKITANAYIQQDLTARRTQFNPATPYYAQVAYNVTPGAVTAGTLTLTLGSKTVTKDLSTASAGWQILRFAIGQDNWFSRFDQAQILFKIALTSLAGNYLLVDDVIIAPYQNFDGSWYAPVGGVTNWLRNDVFTFTDSATESINQYWFWRATGRYLPHKADASETWVDPT